jgi:hypothetical protein
MDKEIKDGGAAFPVVGMDQRGGQSFIGVFQNGMSLRDWFAGMAISGLTQQHWDFDSVIKYTYKIADAMLKEREK